jgi:hypothetical protein
MVSVSLRPVLGFVLQSPHGERPQVDRGGAAHADRFQCLQRRRKVTETAILDNACRPTSPHPVLFGVIGITVFPTSLDSPVKALMRRTSKEFDLKIPLERSEPAKNAAGCPSRTQRSVRGDRLRGIRQSRRLRSRKGQHGKKRGSQSRGATCRKGDTSNAIPVGRLSLHLGGAASRRLSWPPRNPTVGTGDLWSS